MTMGRKIITYLARAYREARRERVAERGVTEREADKPILVASAAGFAAEAVMRVLGERYTGGHPAMFLDEQLRELDDLRRKVAWYSERLDAERERAGMLAEAIEFHVRHGSCAQPDLRRALAACRDAERREGR